MSLDSFIQSIQRYSALNEESLRLLTDLCQKETIAKHTELLSIAVVPKYYYFVDSGLFAYYYLTSTGEKVIKKFFTEKSFMSSSSALLDRKASAFAIVALEDSAVYKISAEQFQNLVQHRHDIALFYIKYLEKNWVIDKEYMEISSKYEDAKIRYINFSSAYPNLLPRLKQHQIASYLGITATQLSRIKKEINPQHM